MASEQFWPGWNFATYRYPCALDDFHTSRIMCATLTNRHTPFTWLLDMVERACTFPQPNSERLLPHRIPKVLHIHRAYHTRRAGLVHSPGDVAARVSSELLHAVCWRQQLHRLLSERIQVRDDWGANSI